MVAKSQSQGMIERRGARTSCGSVRIQDISDRWRGTAPFSSCWRRRYSGLAGAFDLEFRNLVVLKLVIRRFTAIPPIQSSIKENIPLIDGIYWAPQVIGGSGFMISATFLMLAAQDVWWKPKLFSIGWQVGGAYHAN